MHRPLKNLHFCQATSLSKNILHRIVTFVPLLPPPQTSPKGFRFAAAVVWFLRLELVAGTKYRTPVLTDLWRFCDIAVCAQNWSQSCWVRLADTRLVFFWRFPGILGGPRGSKSDLSHWNPRANLDNFERLKIELIVIYLRFTCQRLHLETKEHMSKHC